MQTSPSHMRGCLDGCWNNKIRTDMNSGDIYHERQVRELCALHALNNLFQERDAFSKADLDEICYSLAPNVWFNPHKSALGLGNYDVNVIMAALQRKGFEAVWFDKRKDPKCLKLENIFGFILNVPNDYKFGFVFFPFRRRHWIAIREINGSYYNLDSKLDFPQVIGKAPDVVDYLFEQLESKEKELFVVVSEEVERDQSWQHLTSNENEYTLNNHLTEVENIHPTSHSNMTTYINGKADSISKHSPEPTNNIMCNDSSAAER